MRVALYSETFLPKIDGIVRVACLTLEHLQRRGIEAVIVAPQQGVREYAGARVIGVPGIRNPLYPEGRLNFPTPHVYQQVKAFKPDIMHIFHPVMLGMAGLFFAHQMKVPSIASFHLDLARISAFYKVGFLQYPITRASTWAFNQADYALAPSKLVQREMIQKGVHKVGLWRRGVDAEHFNPNYRNSTMRDLLSDGHPDEVTLLYVGRLAAEKQIEQLRPVLERVRGIRLALVGDGPHREALEQYFAGLPVKFVGYLTGEKLAQAYASGDIFVFPSAFESFGLVILEAMASGLPVVSSRVGGAQDVIASGVSGFTFDVNDVEALVCSVEAIVATPGKLHEMSLAARQQAEAQSWPHMMDELIECYEALLAGQPSPI
ncbi:MAG: glycosyltransferase family 1 protein [Chloroflexota bacterium]